jgi:hypothetical protein
MLAIDPVQRLHLLHRHLQQQKRPQAIPESARAFRPSPTNEQQHWHGSIARSANAAFPILAMPGISY